MSPEEKEEFLQIYLDETEEELDTLVETMLALEEEPKNTDLLNEAFRMVHSMKGAAGMMGLTDITAVTHLLESRFEKMRSGLLLLDQPTMAATLRFVDYLRSCNEKLREDAALPSPVELLNELEHLDAGHAHSNAVRSDTNAAQDTSSVKAVDPEVDTVAETQSAEMEPTSASDSLDQILKLPNYLVTVTFEAGLKLLDMKGQLVVTRITEFASMVAARPSIEELATKTGPVRFELIVSTERSPDELEDAADVHGVMSVEVQPTEQNEFSDSIQDESQIETDELELQAVSKPEAPPELNVDFVSVPTKDVVPVAESSAKEPGTSKEPKKRVAETVRVDIDRLDNLLNLAGELVVNKARFAQIANRMSPTFKRSGDSSRMRSFGDSLRGMIESMKVSGDETGEVNGHTAGLGRFASQLNELEEELAGLEEQWEQWDRGRRCFGQINEAIDQLSRVSDSLQRGVLQTRMVPVAPLFNRFKRVVRDLSLQREKKTNLQIRGEKTELDKRMIDELGDPLVHLVRNSIDHGMESPAERLEAGKPEIGTISLEASHSGNNVFICVRDDGGGIDAAKIRERIVQRGLLNSVDAEHLSDEQAIDYIWHPGFSTAPAVTNISGRGVGMDIVKTRIAELNGTIDVESALGEGTTFTIRLPLTLAIISSLLFRISDVVYGVPIDDVREIVSLTKDEVIAVQGKRTFSVRGKYLPLVCVNDLFVWNGVEYKQRTDHQGDPSVINVVVIQSAGKAIGLRVDELLGGEDIVIKSLSENFVNIRGLSGASILGDGSVSLLLDVGTVLDMAVAGSRSRQAGSQT